MAIPSDAQHFVDVWLDFQDQDPVATLEAERALNRPVHVVQRRTSVTSTAPPPKKPAPPPPLQPTFVLPKRPPQRVTLDYSYFGIDNPSLLLNLKPRFSGAPPPNIAPPPAHLPHAHRSDEHGASFSEEAAQDPAHALPPVPQGRSATVAEVPDGVPPPHSVRPSKSNKLSPPFAACAVDLSHNLLTDATLLALPTALTAVVAQPLKHLTRLSLAFNGLKSVPLCLADPFPTGSCCGTGADSTRKADQQSFVSGGGRTGVRGGSNPPQTAFLPLVSLELHGNQMLDVVELTKLGPLAGTLRHLTIRGNQFEDAYAAARATAKTPPLAGCAVLDSRLLQPRQFPTVAELKSAPQQALAMLAVGNRPRPLCPVPPKAVVLLTFPWLKSLDHTTVTASDFSDAARHTATLGRLMLMG